MVPIIDDNRHELNENFTGVLTLPSGSSGVRLGVATAAVTITDIESENKQQTFRAWLKPAAYWCMQWRYCLQTLHVFGKLILLQVWWLDFRPTRLCI